MKNDLRIISEMDKKNLSKTRESAIDKFKERNLNYSYMDEKNSDYWDVLSKLTTFSESVDNNVLLGTYKNEVEESVIINIKNNALNNLDVFKGANKINLIYNHTKNKYTYFDKNKRIIKCSKTEEEIEDELATTLSEMDLNALDLTKNLMSLLDSLALVSRNKKENPIVMNLVKPPVTIEEQSEKTENKKGMIANIMGKFKRTPEKGVE